jgi:hypothetical protein
MKLSILSLGIALYRISASSLYIELGHRSFNEYIDKLVEDIGKTVAIRGGRVYAGDTPIISFADDLLPDD